MADPEVTLQFVEELARGVGPLILEGFGCGRRSICSSNSSSNSSSSSSSCGAPKTKASAADLVTEFDTRVEDTLKEKIKQKFPNHSFLCEESVLPNQQLTNDPTWIIDPIDGTTNFVHGFPFTCVSIAFARNKEVRVGVVFSPVTKELFSAEKGRGARLNGEVIKSSNCQEIGQALTCVSFGVSTLRQLEGNNSKERTEYLNHFKECVLSNVSYLATHSRDIRHLGSTAMELCYLAAGRLDCIATFGPKEWDLAAGCLILEEAGAVCSDMQGNQPLVLSKHQVLAAATPQLLAVCVQHLKAP